VLTAAETNQYGVAWSNVDLGTVQGDQTFLAQAGGLTTSFYANVRPAPAINSHGVLDAASFQVGKGFAPGSFISIYGKALSDATRDLHQFPALFHVGSERELPIAGR